MPTRRERVPTLAELRKLARRVYPNQGVKVWQESAILIKCGYSRVGTIIEVWESSRTRCRIALAAALRALGKEKA